MHIRLYTRACRACRPTGTASILSKIYFNSLRKKRFLNRFTSSE